MTSAQTAIPGEHPPDVCSWRVMRLDDNGNQYEVTTAPSRSEAQAIADAFEARHHKQTYWVEPIQR